MSRQRPTGSRLAGNDSEPARAFIELQYFRRVTAAEARRDYQPEINSGGHATASYAIAIGNHTLLDGRRTEHREKVAKPPMRCRLVALHESGCPKDQRPGADISQMNSRSSGTMPLAALFST